MHSFPRSLENGITLYLDDLSNRYYGDYNHVQLAVRAVIDTALIHDLTESERKHLGSEVIFKSVLKKMAVPTAMLDVVKEELLDGYTRSSLAYIKRKDFPIRHIRKILSAENKR